VPTCPAETARTTPTPRPGPRTDPFPSVTLTNTPTSAEGTRSFRLINATLRVDLPVAAPSSLTEDEYLAEVQKLIQARWTYPAEATRRGQSGQGVLRFDIAKDGSVRCITIERSTGVEVLDRAIIDAVIGALLPLPPKGGSDPFPATLRFTYTLNAPNAVPGPPPGSGLPDEP
jgi:TonB family protein